MFLNLRLLYSTEVEYFCTSCQMCQRLKLGLLKFIYSEMTTKILPNLHLFLNGTISTSQKKVEISQKICGLLRIYELYLRKNIIQLCISLLLIARKCAIFHFSNLTRKLQLWKIVHYFAKNKFVQGSDKYKYRMRIHICI